MKMKQFITLFLMVVITTNCGPEAPVWESTYKIQNDTEDVVVLRIFELFENGDYEDYNLLVGESFVGVKTKTSNFNYFSNSDNVLPTTSYSSDSIYVIFNNEKIMKHIAAGVNGNMEFSQPTNRNLFRGGNYTDIGSDIYQLVLTQEDYSNATPCNDDCLD